MRNVWRLLSSESAAPTDTDRAEYRNKARSHRRYGLREPLLQSRRAGATELRAQRLSPLRPALPGQSKRSNGRLEQHEQQCKKMHTRLILFTKQPLPFWSALRMPTRLLEPDLVLSPSGSQGSPTSRGLPDEPEKASGAKSFPIRPISRHIPNRSFR
jgi:hypothetical protein